ncbi:MAG: putative toxin-antitoxin system toxin component, PIN family [Candidatus Levybacteria bacterium]|nr:putative toxin-antitoxin system toxin component, PIN family [Candidatus Levybacteria bacterium]
MVKKPPKAVLDTNVIISALVFGGKPEQVYSLILEKQIIGISSPVLLAELTETLTKKFNFELIRVKQLEKIIKKHFKIIHPDEIIYILEDEDDNRVLEAAIEGKSGFIVTGDSDLLTLKTFRQIEILTPDDFLKEIERYIKQ